MKSNELNRVKSKENLQNEDTITEPETKQNNYNEVE